MKHLISAVAALTLAIAMAMPAAAQLYSGAEVHQFVEMQRLMRQARPDPGNPAAAFELYGHLLWNQRFEIEHDLDRRARYDHMIAYLRSMARELDYLFQTDGLYQGAFEHGVTGHSQTYRHRAVTSIFSADEQLVLQEDTRGVLVSVPGYFDGTYARTSPCADPSYAETTVAIVTGPKIHVTAQNFGCEKGVVLDLDIEGLRETEPIGDNPPMLAVNTGDGDPPARIAGRLAFPDRIEVIDPPSIGWAFIETRAPGRFRIYIPFLTTRRFGDATDAHWERAVDVVFAQ